MKRLIFLLITFTHAFVFALSAAEGLDLKDLCSGRYAAKRIHGVTPMNDGEQYTQLSSDAKQILTFSFRTGEQTGVLFDIGQPKGQMKL